MSACDPKRTSDRPLTHLVGTATMASCASRATMRRREFFSLVGGVAAWPLTARAQQPAMPLVGWLAQGSPQKSKPYVAAFHQGLGETGFFEGRNVAIEYRWAEQQDDRLPAMATDLVQRGVSVIATGGGRRPGLNWMYASTLFISGELQKHSTPRRWLCATAVPIEPGDVPITPDGLRVKEF